MAILATALGKLLADMRGLKRLELPGQLGHAFASSLVEACNARAGGNEAAVIALHPSAESHFISPERAAELRSRDDGQPAKATIINFAGEFREWNTLEPFRLLNPSLLPGDVLIGLDAELRLGDLAAAIIDALFTTFPRLPSGEEERAGATITRIARFLGEAYAETGSGELTWDQAWWLHLDMMLNALADVLADWRDQEVDAERLDVALFAAAGLPSPKRPGGYAPGHEAKVFAAILVDRWSSEAAALETATGLAHDWAANEEEASADDFPLLRLLSSHDLTDALARKGQVLASLALLGEREASVERARAWALVSEDEFFLQRTKECKASLLTCAGEQAEPLPVIGGSGAITVLPVFAGVRSDARLELGRFEVVVDDPDIQFEDIRCSPASLSVTVSGEPRREGSHTHLPVDLTLDLPDGHGSWREATFRLDLDLRDGQDKKVDTAPLNLFLPFPASSSVLIFESKKGGGDGRRFVPPARPFAVDGDQVAQSADDAREVRVPSGITRVNLYSIGERPNVTPSPTWTETEGFPAWLVLAKTLQVAEGLEVTCSGDTLVVTHDEQEDAPVSPVLAAARDVIARDDGAEVDEFRSRADPRWIIEQWQGETFLSDTPSASARASLGQVQFAIDEHRPDGDLVSQHDGGQFTLGQVQPILNHAASVAELDAVKGFWEAFDALDLPSLCAGRVAENARWPSKIDLRGLAREKVENYLDAYHELLGAAAIERQYLSLAYPFACIAFSQVEGRVRGVMLTALHPLRLAWNWAAQQAGKEAAEVLGPAYAVDLLRFMDGSEIPCVGPALTLGDALVATPLSPGLGSLFATWSFLAVPGALVGDKAPQMGGNPLPAGAVSGLNSDSVGAAIRDYLRVNPYVTSLDIELYTMKEKVRSAELDEAIVSQLEPLLGGQAGDLPGGLQVIDSANRKGNPPPRQAVLARVVAAQQARHTGALQVREIAVPFSWTNSVNANHQVDLRFLEDSIVSMSVEQAKEQATGASTVPSLPVARRSAWQHVAGEPATSYVRLGGDQARGLGGFTRAIDAFEELTKGSGPVRREANIPAAATLRDKSARWLIAGNMHLDPRALAGALEHMQSGAVLWEWRPPYMERRSRSWDQVVPARPYAVIANPSPDFKLQVAECLKAIACGSGETTADAVLSALGTRGVGLASLLSMGHQQSRGAVGFYLGFELLKSWENKESADRVRMVLPLDAINPVLQLLARGAAGDVTRKADILLIEAVEVGDRFTLALRAVEIKMHASAPAEHAFPAGQSLGVTDALEQLGHSGTLLAALEEAMEPVGQVALLQSALTAVLESAISLSTTGTSEIARRLMLAAADGRVSLSSNPGVLLWFEVGGRSASLPYAAEWINGVGFLAMDPAPLLASHDGDEARAISVLLETMLTEPVAARPAAPPPGDSPDGDEPAPIVVAPREAPAGDPGPATSAIGDALAPTASSDTGAQAAGIPVHLGWTRQGLSEEELFFDPRDTRINQLNMGVVGDLGTGKTQFLKSLVYQMTRPVETQEAPAKAFVFDYKKDYVDDAFTAMVGAKVLDPSVTPIPLNFFAIPGGGNRFELGSRALLFADTIDKIYAIGPNQNQALRSAILDAYADVGTPMLGDVLDRYRAAMSGNDSVTSALSLMVDFGLFEADPAKLVGFEQLFDQSVVLALGNIAEAGTQVQNLLVTLFLNLLHVEYMKKRTKMPIVRGVDGINRRVIDSYVLVDEAHNIMDYEFESLRKLLLEGREFGMGVILSSQYLSHFKTRKTNWAEPLLTWAIHKVPNVTSAELQRIGFRQDLDEICNRISSLDVHHSLFKSPVGRASTGTWLREKPFYQFARGD